MEKCTIFSGKVFCLITGASRGYGRAAARAFARCVDFEEGSVMVLVARSASDLQETKKLVQDLNNKIEVRTEVFNLEDVASIQTLAPKLFSENTNFNTSILINNAGTLGDPSKKLVEPLSLDYYRKFFDVNVISVIALIQEFCNAFKSQKKVVVNISSLAAIQEMAHMSLYCISKAAREMLHKALACEEEDIRVLNYAPGPMETAMSMDIQLNCGNESSREFFKSLRETKKIIDPDVSAEKMIKVLKTNEFKSGDHIDFYDVE